MGIHIWLPKDSARKLDSCQKLIAKIRGGRSSRGELLSIFIDELTEARVSALEKLYADHGMNLTVALSASMARGLDQHISEARKRLATELPPPADGDDPAGNEMGGDEACPRAASGHDGESPYLSEQDQKYPNAEPEVADGSDEQIGDDFLAFVNEGVPPIRPLDLP